MGAINHVQTGGMSPERKAQLRENLKLGEVIQFRKANGKRGIISKHGTVIAKYEHYFIVDYGNYKDTLLYIDLHSPQEEVEENDRT